MPSDHPNLTYQTGSPQRSPPDRLDQALNVEAWDDLGDPFMFDEGMESLVLPPINSNNNHNDGAALPAFDDAPFFDALPRLPSHISFSQEHTARSSQNEPPPPSAQQVHRSGVSQYQVTASESPDPFAEYLEPTPSPSPAPVRRNVHTGSSSVVDLTESSPVQNRIEMPSAGKKRKREISGEERVSKVTRQGNSQSDTVKPEDSSKVELVDLSAVETDEQYKDFNAKEEALRAKEQADLIKQQNQAEGNKPVKLAEFQCIICMDNPTDLTVTHCGHLFCSECLHSALHAGDKKCCPVCRTAITTTRPANGKLPRNGIFALEMKLMTTTKKGKQPARTQ